jgi:hypothetical protein
VRADGLAAVLGPLLNDPRIVLAALVDVDSGMVLDACTPEGPQARFQGADLEMTGAGHAELARVALALPGRAGPTPAGDELVVSAGPDRHHLVLALPDPHGGRLVLSVVVDGPRRLALRVLRRLRAVPAETLTAGPTVVRRPGVGGWVTPLDPPPPVDDRAAAGPGVDPNVGPGVGYRQFGPPHPGAPVFGAPQHPDFQHPDPAYPDRSHVALSPGGPLSVDPSSSDRGTGHRSGRPDECVAAGPAGGWSGRPVADPFPRRAETAPPRPAADGLFDASRRPPAGPGPARWPVPDPVASGVAPIGLAEPPVGPPVDQRPVARPQVPPVEVVRPPAPPSALPPGRRG